MFCCATRYPTAGWLWSPKAAATTTWWPAPGHIVSLSDAWASGAWEWTSQERIAFANDLGNLLAVDGPTNQAKSDQGPPHWLPEVNRCRYVEQYVQVKDTYGLGVSDDAIAGLRHLLQQCP